MRIFLAFFSLIILASCGFSPMYGKPENSAYTKADMISNVAIANIPNRDGQYLRNALIDRLYLHGRPATPDYTLHIKDLNEQLRDLDITIDSDATRGQLRLDARLELINTQTDKIVLERNIYSIASYNILASEFTNRVSEQSTREHALDDLARQAELQINLYFQRQKR